MFAVVIHFLRANNTLFWQNGPCQSLVNKTSSFIESRAIVFQAAADVEDYSFCIFKIIFNILRCICYIPRPLLIIIENSLAHEAEVTRILRCSCGDMTLKHLIAGFRLPRIVINGGNLTPLHVVIFLLDPRSSKLVHISVIR